MSLTYGYDLKDGDDMIAAAVQADDVMSRHLLPGAALVNNFPFCEIFYFLLVIIIPITHDCSSETHPFMGTMVQLRSISTRG
jgi:hypothetical protein